jgi:hypothetical protein
LFAPLNADTLSQVAPEFRPEHGRWIGIARVAPFLSITRKKSAKLSCRIL